MTALLPPGGRKVVRPAAARQRGDHPTGRHAAAPGRPPMPLHTGRHATVYTGRHAVVSRSRRSRRSRPAHAALDRYDRLMLGLAGWLLAVRVALVGEKQLDGRY
ncbi:hypothetical protein [Nocardia sp. alder85J]|uniref:hypothetical protein n=1 Tax=Nocardia sp. alder85J TaxID=2862949 RepID=UPI001CD7577B|nr:hypothetical protein [Nocardia sp. alder85J]MCX4096436.1 hypothetical protein [Nocardia sp. alder85J]